MKTFHGALLALCLFQPVADGAEAPVRVRIAGGLLGRVDGFCERMMPGAPAPFKFEASTCPEQRIPLGGIAGLRKDFSGKDWYSLLSGDNFPKDIDTDQTEEHRSFWSALKSLRADVIALGQDDFLRAALPAHLHEDSSKSNPHLAGFNAKWQEFLTRGVEDYRFLATNAAIRRHKKGLNSVKSGRYHLTINPNESLPWITRKLRLELPAGAAGDFSVWQLKPENHKLVQKKVHDGLCSDDDSCKLGGTPHFPTLDFEVSLTPGAEYAVRLNDKALANFFTDDALTPWPNQNAGELQRLPAAVLSGRGASLLVMAMVDPGVKSMLGSDHWSYDSGDGPAERAEIVFTPPADTAKAIFGRARGHGDQAAPLGVLLADLSDAQTLKVLAASSRWRIVALHPDSEILGCAVDPDPGCDKQQKAYTDFGRYAILNQKNSPAASKDPENALTQLWVRPEWLAESMMEIKGRALAANDDSYITMASIERHDVQGDIRRGSLLGGARPLISYYLRDSKTELDSGVAYRAYPRRAEEPPWLADSQSVALKLMEAMRRERHTEIAVANLAMIDADVVDELVAANTTALSPRDLADILWRHDVYVTVPVKASELTDMLQKLAAAPAVDGEGFCVWGVEQGEDELGCKIPQSLDPGQVRINGRFLDPNMEYSVAVPQTLAESLKLSVPMKKHYTDVVAGLDRYLRSADHPVSKPLSIGSSGSKPSGNSFLPPASSPAKSEPSGNPLVTRWLGMLYIPPASVELGGQNYSVPDGIDPSKFSSIPLAGEQVTHTFKFNLSGEIHLIPVDLTAVSLDLVSKVNLNRLDTYNDSNPRLTQMALSPDDWLNGVYLRSRYLSNQVARGMAGISRTLTGRPLRIEPFVGFFNESSLFHLHRTFTTKRPVDSGSTVYLTEDDRKPNYTFFETGMALGDVKLPGPFSLKGNSYRFDWGTNHSAITGVRVGPYLLPISDVRNCGLQKLLDEKCQASVMLDSLDDNSRVDFAYTHRRENRQQLASTLEFVHGPEGKSQIKVDLDFHGNLWHFNHDETTLLEPLWSTEYNLKVTLPLPYGIALGPYVRYYRVKAFGEAGIFDSKRYGVTLTFPFYGKLGVSRFLY